MFKNYLRVTFRNLIRRRAFTILNIGGMGIGLATGLLVLFWVQHEMSFDAFHTHASSLYRVNANVDGFDTWEATPQPIATYARQNLPEVQMAARVRVTGVKQLFQIGEKRFFEKNYGIVDSTFFQVFDFPLVEGDKTKPFQDAKSIILSETTAQRFFGLENPMFKTIEYKEMTLTVTGVMEDFPDNSTYDFDFVLNNAFLQQQCIEKPGSCYRLPEEDWGNYQHYTWLVLQPNADQEKISRKFTEILYKNNTSLKEGQIAFLLQPISTLHLYNTNGTPGRIKLIRIFTGIAILILLLAAMNYVNLATAMAAQRVKEISIRKIVGAGKQHLFGQFWLETAVMLGCSLIVALVMMELVSPYYFSLSGKEFHIGMLGIDLWKVVAITMLSVWILTGIYPAMLLSSFKPLIALKGDWMPMKGASLRKGLIILQFTASAGLLICAFVMNKQLQFMQEKDLGFDTEQVLEFPIWRFTKDFAFVKDEVMKLPGATDITAYNGSLFLGASSTDEIKWEGQTPDKRFVIQQLGIAPNFLDFFKIPVIEGRSFDKDHSGGTLEVLLNETAVKSMGLTDPVGQTITFHTEPATIIGITKDIHVASMREAIEPAIFCLDPESLGNVYVKTSGQHASDLIAATEEFWVKHQPDFPFEYQFVDEQYGKLYEKEMQTRQLFQAFSFIALFISCLGLFGLAMQAAERRTKEIGIRKVLGATVVALIGLMSKQFLKLVTLSLLIASPLAWLLMDEWLSGFAYRVNIGWWIFALAGGIALTVAFLTVSFHSIRAALANPIKSLRSE